MGDGGFMDVMSRREIMGKVLAGMASGARVEKGTFTVPNGVSSFTLNFQNVFDKYFILVEASSESKTEIINTGSADRKTFAVIAIYPKRSINNTDDNYNALDMYLVPSTNTLAASSLNIATLTNSSFGLRVRTLSSSTSNALIEGLTYNYTIVEIK